MGRETTPPLASEGFFLLRHIEKCSLLTDPQTAFEKDTFKRLAADMHQNLIHHSSLLRIAVQEVAKQRFRLIFTVGLKVDLQLYRKRGNKVPYLLVHVSV